jgi:hypothetical protein
MYHDGIMDSFVLPFPLPCYPSLAFSYSCTYAFAHTYIYRNIYDVSRRKRKAYRSGGSYAVTVLAGKYGSALLDCKYCMPSLRIEDAVQIVADCSRL